MKMRFIGPFVAGMLVVLGIPAVAQNVNGSFPDVESSAYFSSAVEDLSRMGIIRGYADGRFGPNDFVTRGQVAVMFQRYDNENIAPLRKQIRELRQELGQGICGDERIQTGEECDDGNTMDGDGCSAYCQQEETRGVLCEGKYKPGESYKSSDGCNTCFCGENGVSGCTKMYCGGQQEEQCYSSDDCSGGMRCSTERGDCQSACEPGAEACIQVCAGKCEARPGGEACAPHICADGTQHPACSEDGHPINYFAEPCHTNGGPAGEAQACTREKRAFDALVDQNQTCRTDADCTVFIAGCPYMTCGVALNEDAQDMASTAADAYTTCMDRAGSPLPCAKCVAYDVSCQQGKCTLETPTR